VTETIGHILLGVGLVKMLGVCVEEDPEKKHKHEDFVAIIETLQQDMEPNDMELIVVVARTLWFCRNGVVHGRTFNHPSLLVSNVVESLEAYSSVNARQMIRPETIPITNLRWQCLLESFVKVNWNATVDKDNRKMGIGMIIRDYEGKVLATLSAPKKLYY
jgi:hypothetical protein